MLPRSGGPHAQLALVAGLERNHVAAAYHYARAALSEAPSGTAAENLVRLYARMRRDAETGA